MFRFLGHHYRVGTLKFDTSIRVTLQLFSTKSVRIGFRVYLELATAQPRSLTFLQAVEPWCHRGNGTAFAGPFSLCLKRVVEAYGFRVLWFAKPESHLLAVCFIGIYDELCSGASQVDNIDTPCISRCDARVPLVIGLSLVFIGASAFGVFTCVIPSVSKVFRTASQVAHRRPLASSCYVTPKSTASLSLVRPRYLQSISSLSLIVFVVGALASADPALSTQFRLRSS